MMDKNTLRQYLDAYGELHVTLESGDEYHVHKQEVDYDGCEVILDTKKGTWIFCAESIESLEIPVGHKE